MKKHFLIGTIFMWFFLGVIFSGYSRAETYYPLKEGRIWEYQMLGPGGTAKVIVTNLASRELKGKKVTPQKIDSGGQSNFIFISEDAEGIYKFAVQLPVDVEPEIIANPNYDIKYPIKVGTSWDVKSELSLITSLILIREKVPVTLKYSIESIDEVVTVPAGTFKGCVKVKGIGTAKEEKLGEILFISDVADVNVEEYFWYAPGVGMIKSIRKEKKEKSKYFRADSGELTLQLESFK